MWLFLAALAGASSDTFAVWPRSSPTLLLMVDSRPLERAVGADVVTRCVLLNLQYAERHAYDFVYVKHSNFSYSCDTCEGSPAATAQPTELHVSPFKRALYRRAKRSGIRHVKYGWKRSASWAKLPVLAAALEEGGYQLVLFVDTDAFFHEQQLGWTEWLHAHSESVDGAKEALTAPLSFFGGRPWAWACEFTAGIIAARRTRTTSALLRMWWDAWSPTHGENYFEQNTMRHFLGNPKVLLPALPKDDAALAGTSVLRRLPIAIIQTPINAAINSSGAHCRHKRNCLPRQELLDYASCADYWLCHLTTIGLGMRIRLVSQSLRKNGLDDAATQARLLPPGPVRIDLGRGADSAASRRALYIQLNATRCSEQVLEATGFGGGPYAGTCISRRLKRDRCDALFVAGTSPAAQPRSKLRFSARSQAGALPRLSQGHLRGPKSRMVSAHNSLAVRAFVEELARTAPKSGLDPIVMDVGANVGRWGSDVLKQAYAAAPTRRVELVQYEPNPAYRKRLARLAAQWNSTHVEAAAWVEVGSTKLHVAKLAVASSLSAGFAGARKFGKELHSLTVRTVDLAADVRKLARPGRAMLFSLDIEGAEYRVIPHLLATGALCLPRFIFFEWHLNALNNSEVLAGMGIRVSIDHALRAACRPAPLVIEHEDHFGNNNWDHIPPALQNFAASSPQSRLGDGA